MVSKKLSKPEVEKIIKDLYSEGVTSEKIGLVLRDKYGIKKFREEFGMKVTEILGVNDADVRNVRRKMEKLQVHFEKNKHDQSAKRRLIKTAAQVKKVGKYHS